MILDYLKNELKINYTRKFSNVLNEREWETEAGQLVSGLDFKAKAYLDLRGKYLKDYLNSKENCWNIKRKHKKFNFFLVKIRLNLENLHLFSGKFRLLP